MAKRQNFTDQFKAKMALETLRADKTAQEIATKHQLHLLPAGVRLQTPRNETSEHTEAACHCWNGGCVPGRR